MTQDVLLYQLRERLRLVHERIAQRENERAISDLHSLHSAGALTELHSEVAFLTNLIAQIEQEGVTP